jgi:Na+-driven multidrug efflux pump
MRTPKSSTQKPSRKRREGKSALAEFDGVKPIADAKDSAVRGQVAIMLVGSILVVVIVASRQGVAQRICWWCCLLATSCLITPFLPYRGGLDFRAIYIAFFANLAYWFALIFWFVLWSDRRWRRKRAARIGA